MCVKYIERWCQYAPLQHSCPDWIYVFQNIYFHFSLGRNNPQGIIWRSCKTVVMYFLRGFASSEYEPGISEVPYFRHNFLLPMLELHLISISKDRDYRFCGSHCSCRSLFFGKLEAILLVPKHTLMLCYLSFLQIPSSSPSHTLPTSICGNSSWNERRIQ